jgi:hypothetical protein
MPMSDEELRRLLAGKNLTPCPSPDRRGELPPSPNRGGSLVGGTQCSIPTLTTAAAVEQMYAKTGTRVFWVFTRAEVTAKVKVKWGMRSVTYEERFLIGLN